MNFESKLIVIGITSLLIIGGPFILWGALSVAVRKSSLNSRSLLWWFRGFRWVVWSCGLVLWVGYGVGYFMGRPHFLWVYPCSVATFSAGLVFPERWLKEQISPTDLT
jgi:hypothetical protein